MRLFILSVVALTLTACASTPKFQRTEGAHGYAVREIDGRDHLMIDLNLPSGEQERFYRLYGYRAVGEECLSRGYQYFNAPAISLGQYEGFCSATRQKMLGITFSAEGLQKNPLEFSIEKILEKPKTSVLVGDKVLEMDGRKLVGATDHLAATFAANKKGQTSITLKIQRASKTLTLEEPLASFERNYLDQADLEDLRGQL